ncbi:Uncharacterized protein FKW44_013460 [Caligus rogercresseyi]|uniref:Uncharacterized protein n=1 Tax=Caligus rogercresseyi TaxID=217165 RepID=A0A7T8JSL8_CALRO|nr:Uncharacterized protein FKW44_025390 [Caligus rogercresseyi]QQP38844.1 Uncharacterized protein FKW44_019539 [Caligus rogercresseyi]QQP39513.1 Uncharacterized protein FKW44_020424 [Caligus rogercresseyi]QQP49783.1 Uncharacterized protein FKW44_010569 [Caligus rogercresseyi]QQP51961.1 Uncharacterized protein FKW44_013460 [Caligus rogercresseyi]
MFLGGLTSPTETVISWHGLLARSAYSGGKDQLSALVRHHLSVSQPFDDTMLQLHHVAPVLSLP